MVSITGINQLRGDTQRLTGFAHAALKNGLHSELFPDLLDVRLLAAKLERRDPRCNPQVGDLAQGIQDFLCDTLTKITLVTPLAHVIEGQHRNGGRVFLNALNICQRLYIAGRVFTNT